jgi:peptidoglycan/xylan/chitin deacetylase (PgdA/CDA1 family)
MAAIEAQLPAGETARLLEAHPTLRIVDAAELRQLAGSGAEIGSHGVHHEMHTAGQPADVRARELSDSKRALEALLGKPCRAFAFPNGDILPESPDEAARAGYLAAFTTEEASADAGAPLHALPRIAAPGTLERFVRVFSFDGEAARGAAVPAGTRVPVPSSAGRRNA